MNQKPKWIGLSELADFELCKRLREIDDFTLFFLISRCGERLILAAIPVNDEELRERALDLITSGAGTPCGLTQAFRKPAESNLSRNKVIGFLDEMEVDDPTIKWHH